MSAESYLCKISQTIILRINLILVLIIDKIKCKTGRGSTNFEIYYIFLPTEVEAFESAVTDWELKLYFARI